jgi:predicted CXXCH cytochrome family protein
MITPQTDGDCNACHAQFGTPAPKGAPGRVMSP